MAHVIPQPIILLLIVWAVVLRITGVTNDSPSNHRPVSRKLEMPASPVLRYSSFSFIVSSIISILFMWTASYAVYSVIFVLIYFLVLVLVFQLFYCFSFVLVFIIFSF